MPLALINLVTRFVLVVAVAVVVVLLEPTEDDDDDEEETTNTILAMSSILIWNSKDASILANVSKRPPPPDLGEILLAWKIGPSWDVDSSMAPLPMTMIRKDNFDL